MLTLLFLRRRPKYIWSVGCIIFFGLIFIVVCNGRSKYFFGKSTDNNQIIFINRKPDFKAVKHLDKDEKNAAEEDPAGKLKVLEEREYFWKNNTKKPLGQPLMLSKNLDIQERIYEVEIQKEIDSVIPGLGEWGAPVVINEEEIKEVEEVMKKVAFNKIASDKMSLHRNLSDVRNPKCRLINYDVILPMASVIITFTNEAWSPLLRTIHSVLNRSPEQFLKEIILVDDFSDKENLKDKLDYYVSRHLPDKVRLVRLKERHGLIRARLEGAKAATGDVIIFLDSHCEVTQGWLEPLLARIKESRTSVVVPIIDVIDDKTLQYFGSNGEFFQIGGFTWSGHFTWINVPEREKKRRGSPVGPTRSPTMAGGLFAIDRKYFWEIGSYDEGMDVWGGENLEISFRIWMCGGTLETMPCSRVGHIFRSFHPYSFPGNKDTHGLNTARMAEVWMDDYKRLFYLYRTELKNDSAVGDISKRKKLRNELGCKSFRWFLDNIMPEKFILDEHALEYGKVRNSMGDSSLCLDTLQRNEDNPYFMGYYPCHSFLSTIQFISLSNKSHLRKEEMCAIVDSQDRNTLGVDSQDRNAPIRMVPCLDDDLSQTWVHTGQKELKNVMSGLCLDRGSVTSVADAFATKCGGTESQKWYFDNTNIV